MNFHFEKSKTLICCCAFSISIIRLDRVIQMLVKSLGLLAVDGLAVDVVRVVADPLRKKKNHRQHLMKISAMNRNERNQRRHAADHHADAHAKQKNPKNLKSAKRMKKNCQNQKATKARCVCQLKCIFTNFFLSRIFCFNQKLY